MFTRRIVFDLALIAFVVSAGFGFWTAHDATAFTSRFVVLLLGAVLALAATRLPSWRSLNGAMMLFALAGVALSLRFLVFNDWASPEWEDRNSKLALLDGLFRLIPNIMPAGLRLVIEPDVAGGIAAVSTPFVALMLAQSRARASHFAFIAWGVAGFALALTLFVSLSYGAWLATGLALGLWVGWRLSGRWLTSRGWDEARAWRVRVAVIAAALAIGAAVYAALVFLPPVKAWPVIGSAAARSSTWLYALPLARDYAFTGLGLGNFGRAYPIYALLTYYYVTPRTRNVFADVLIEQGMLGLISFVAMLAVAIVSGVRALRHAFAESRLVEASLAAVTVVLINGLGNNPLNGSDSLALGGLFALLPMAFVMAGARLTARNTAPQLQLAKPGLAFAGLAAVGLMFWQPLLAAWHANLGAVGQTRAELAIHDPIRSDTPSLDEARQMADLSPAMAEFDQALALDPANPTARQRLSQIALAHGQTEQALVHAQAAWDAGHRDTITRLVLGDAYVADGRVAEAVALVRGIGQAEPRFRGQAWYRYWVNDDFERAAYFYAAAVALDPTNTDAAFMQAEAERLAKEKH
jgi:tetratricopeptide (TPR) repeat protein